MGYQNRSFKVLRFLPVQFAVYVFFRSVLCAINCFHFEQSKRIGQLLGKVIWACDPKHRKIAEKNVLAAEGTPKEPHAVRRFVHRAYEHLGRMTVEFLMIPRLMAIQGLNRYVQLEGKEHAEAAMKLGKGAVLVIPHLGNWELAGLACGLAGIKFTVIYRPPENIFIDAYIRRIRTVTGIELYPKYGAFGEMQHMIKQGKMLLIFADQNARDAGVFVPFLGRPASTVKSPAMLAMRLGCPILTGYTYRIPGDKHMVKIEPAVIPGKYASAQDGIYQLTRSFTDRFDRHTREHPEQYLWQHARWKSRPPEEMAGAAQPEAAEEKSLT